MVKAQGICLLSWNLWFFFFDAGLKEVNADMLRSCKKGDRKGVVLAKSFGRVGAVLC